jgi:RNA recognition motif-containing protein
MRVSYAKAKSDIVSKKDGSFRPREKNAYAAAPAPTPMETTTAAPPRIAAPDASAPPSNILFAQNLPVDCTAAALSMLFTVHAGFTEVRMIPGKPGIAFVEFDDEARAATAMQSLNGFRLTPTDAMVLSYAKR